MAEPLWSTLTEPSERADGQGELVAAFVDTLCRQTKDSIAGRSGEPLHLRDWQKRLAADIFARRPDGRRRHRRGLVGVPRKNGKSALSSGIALADLFVTGPAGGEVYSCAADKEQARIVFGMAKRMVELEPELSAQSKLYKDAIEVPATGSVYRVLSAEAFTKEGLNPSLVIFDEVHAQPNDELWNVMSLAGGARLDPMLLGITTAGVMTDSRGDPSLCYRLFEYGRQVASGEVDDPSFFFRWWGMPDGADHLDPDVQRAANPGYGDIVAAEDFDSAAKTTPENEFRTKRGNQWVTSNVAWLPHGAWEALDERPEPDDGTPVVVGFDGSKSWDSTALIGCTMDGQLFEVGVWERPHDAPPSWHVPRSEVDAALDRAITRWDVRRVACDPSLWSTEVEDWAGRYGEQVVLEFPNSNNRMGPACQRFYAAVLEQTVSVTEQNPTLERHVRNAATKDTRYGVTIVKQQYTRKIDAAIAAVMAYESALTFAEEPSAAVFVDVV